MPDELEPEWPNLLDPSADPEGFHLYAADGRKINLFEYAMLMNDDEYRVVTQDQVGEFRISTVWLGVDMNLFPGPPMIFETMIFGGSLNLQMWRYPTREAAEEGHREAIKLAQMASDVDEVVPIPPWANGLESRTREPHVDHLCLYPEEAPQGAVWRCECGQLWQLSPTQGRWITVSDHDAEVFRHLGFDLP